MRAALVVAALALSGGCASAPPWTRGASWPGAPLLIVGEQHDAAEHHRVEASIVQSLAAQGRLQAVALEMAERGHDTTKLPRDASEAAMRDALAWNDRGWPWADYGPIVVAAVRAGVPVFGANLPRSAQRAAMGDAALDAAVSADVRAALTADVREGHCNLLPTTQLPAMTRIQIARDQAMAQALIGLAQPPKVVVLITGAEHANDTRGVPQHLQRLAPTLKVHTLVLVAGDPDARERADYDEIWSTPPVPAVDHCAALKHRLQAPH